MSKRPKFIIGDNPMMKENSSYITHMEDPVFYAEVYDHADKQEQSDFHDYIIKFQEEQGISVGVGRDKDFYQPFTLAFLGQVPDNQEIVDKMATIMKEMADWYQELIIWEDKHFE